MNAILCLHEIIAVSNMKIMIDYGWMVGWAVHYLSIYNHFNRHVGV